MNFFYFAGDFFGPLAADGEKFFSRWSGGEWGLPGAVSRLIGKKMISMGAAAVGGPWCGVTYGSDGPAVERAIGETYGAAPLWRNA
jgi:hypothetical protein